MDASKGTTAKEGEERFTFERGDACQYMTSPTQQTRKQKYTHPCAQTLFPLFLLHFLLAPKPPFPSLLLLLPLASPSPHHKGAHTDLDELALIVAHVSSIELVRDHAVRVHLLHNQRRVHHLLLGEEHNLVPKLIARHEKLVQAGPLNGAPPALNLNSNARLTGGGEASVVRMRNQRLTSSGRTLPATRNECKSFR